MPKKVTHKTQNEQKNDALAGTGSSFINSEIKPNEYDLRSGNISQLNFEKLIEINSEWLRYFYVLCIEKNFTKATKVLNITPQTLSKAISGIENQLAIQLIEREKDKSFKGLTLSGNIFFEMSHKIIGNIFEIEDSFNLIKMNEPKGTIKLGWLSLTGGKLLAVSISKFLNKYPQIDFKVNYVSPKNLFRQIYDNKIDIGIYPENVINERLVCIAKLPVKYVIAGKPQEKKKWNEFSYISPNTSLSESGRVSSLGWPEEGFDRNIVMQSGSILLTVELCKRGIGVGFFPEILIRDELKNGELAVVADTPFPSEKMLYIYGKNNIFNSVILSDFIKQLKKDIKLLSEIKMVENE
jgi:LysR family hydrogen peroxide-inducible transcriptional activator